jgi:hypothetical protein
MATAIRRGYGDRKGSRQPRRDPVTDYQRANALIWLSNEGEAVVHSHDIEQILRTIPPSRVVLVRRTADGTPVYRVTSAGQRWAIAQLASSLAHSGGVVAKRVPSVPHAPEPMIETRQFGRGGEWRVVDYVRKVRTPWLTAVARTGILEKAAKMAVRRTDPQRLTHRHTRDDDWVVVHAF